MKRLKYIMMSVTVVLGLGGVAGIIALRASVLPPAMNMSSTHGGHTGMAMPDMPDTEATPIDALVALPSDAPVRAFTLTAQRTSLVIGDRTIEAWTFDGVAPGPELRVRQGDLVVVRLVNRDIAAGVTLHWHGVAVPNAMDGVAGVTQDAVRPGADFTYRFIARDAGTYWYHSHQQSFEQVARGLYGVLVVEPRDLAPHADRDYAIDLREWNADADCYQGCDKTLTINGGAGVRLAANPGERVRLRILNSGQDRHLPVLLGAAATVVALDGHDLNAPTTLGPTRFSIAPAQRYDLHFIMPGSGGVALIDADPQAAPAVQHPAATFGAAVAPTAYPDAAPVFDVAGYGAPSDTAPISADGPFDADYRLELGNRLGLLDGAPTMIFTINDKASVDLPPLVVHPGQLVRISINNPTDDLHPLHLHGHAFAVLRKNGQPLRGSPVTLDTLAVGPGESYQIAFRADNPGLWMDHCHVLRHAAKGMGIMVVYPNIATPFSIGRASGNLPD